MSEVLWLDPAQIEPNPWNPNVVDGPTKLKIRASIVRFGFIDPVTVRPVEDYYQIIDGENRWMQARELELSEIPCFSTGTLSDDDAKQLTLVLNELHGTPDRERLDAVLADLQQRHSFEYLAEVLPFDRRAFDAAAGKLKADWEALEDRKKAASTAGWVERVYRLPREYAEIIDEAVEAAKESVDEEDWKGLVTIARAYSEP